MGHDEATDGGEHEPAVPDRRCGRCQRAFAGDPTLTFQSDWALCPECETVLLPRRMSTTPPVASR